MDTNTHMQHVKPHCSCITAWLCCMETIAWCQSQSRTAFPVSRLEPLRYSKWIMGNFVLNFFLCSSCLFDCCYCCSYKNKATCYQAEKQINMLAEWFSWRLTILLSCWLFKRPAYPNNIIFSLVFICHNLDICEISIKWKWMEFWIWLSQH